MDTQETATTEAVVNVPAQATPAGRRPTPERRPEFAHLSLGALREYRKTLVEEEGRVSYWRRIIQARLDLVRVSDSRTSAGDNLRDVLSGVRIHSTRGAIVDIVPLGDVPPLPNLAALWTREPRPGDDAHNSGLELELAAAESQLSAYRQALHERLGAATNELIARYHQEPALCLIALPGDRASV